MWWGAYLYRRIKAGEAGPPTDTVGEESQTEHRIAGESVEVA